MFLELAALLLDTLYMPLLPVQVSWTIDHAASLVHTTYTYVTQTMEGTATGTIIGMLPHQWKAADASVVLAPFAYPTLKGLMKMVQPGAASFSTTLVYHGILPYLPPGMPQ